MPLVCFSSVVAAFDGDFGGSSPGSKLSKALKKSPVLFSS